MIEFLHSTFDRCTSFCHGKSKRSHGFSSFRRSTALLCSSLSERGREEKRGRSLEKSYILGFLVECHSFLIGFSGDSSLALIHRSMKFIQDNLSLFTFEGCCSSSSSISIACF